MDTALSELHDAPTSYQANHGDRALIVAGDFNSANLCRVLANFPIRGERTLDHCYTHYKDGYKVQSLPAFCKSDNATIFLLSKYKQQLKMGSSSSEGGHTLD